MTSKRMPGASRNGSGDRTLSKNARSQQLRSYSFFSLPQNCKKQQKRWFWEPKPKCGILHFSSFFGIVCCLFSDTSPEGSRDAFWSNFGWFQAILVHFVQFVKGVVPLLKGDGQLVKGADSLKLLSKLAVFPLLLIQNVQYFSWNILENLPIFSEKSGIFRTRNCKKSDSVNHIPSVL